jgi:hypothetical protein
MSKDRKPIKITFGTILLIVAGLVNLGRWIGVFAATESAPAWMTDYVLPVMGIVSAISMGVVMMASTAFISYRLGRMRPFREIKRRGREEYRRMVNVPFWVASFAGVAILGMSIFLLWPYVRMVMPAQLLALLGTEASARMWSILAVTVSDLVVMAIALADSDAASFTATHSAKTSDADSETSDGSATLTANASDADNVAQRRSKRKSATLQAKLYRCECGFTDADRYVVSGHKGQCAAHLQAKAGQPIPVVIPAMKEQQP